MKSLLSHETEIHHFRRDLKKRRKCSQFFYICQLQEKVEFGKGKVIYCITPMLKDGLRFSIHKIYLVSNADQCWRQEMHKIRKRQGKQGIQLTAGFSHFDKLN